MRYNSQVIDVFNVAPSESIRSLTIEQAKAMLNRNGIKVSRLSDSKIAAFAQQSSAGQARAIQAYHENSHKSQQSQQEEDSDIFDEEAPSEVQPLRQGVSRENWSASDEELIYRTIKRTKRDPISIELGQNESKAAKAAIG